MGTVIWWLNQGGYGIAAKNCYSWGQIPYFCKQAQTWPTFNKLQCWLISSLFFKKMWFSLYPKNAVPISVLAWVQMSNVPPSPRPCFYIHFLPTSIHQTLRRYDALLTFTLLPAYLFSTCLSVIRSSWAEITPCKPMILSPHLIRTLNWRASACQLSHKGGPFVCF